MSFIETIAEENATGATAAMYATSRSTYGYLPNMVALFGYRPDVFAAWAALNAAVKGNMDLRRYELATIAAARELRSSYCMLAHGKIMLGGLVDEEQLESILDDPRSPALTAAERAIMRFAAKVARDASSVEAADVGELRDHGLSEAEIFDVVAASAMRCFYSKTLDALGAQPDAAYSVLPDGLREKLVVGRAIAG